VSMQMLALVDAEPTSVHRQTSPHYGITDDNVWYPVNHRQLRDLLGKLLTHLDAMSLPDRAHKAAKTLIVQEIWRWWDDAADNSHTSAAGCIAPVVVANGGRYVDGVAASNRLGWESEAQWLAGGLTGSEPRGE
jgi:hypothetical protein